jgi:hypothetical protein
MEMLMSNHVATARRDLSGRNNIRPKNNNSSQNKAKRRLAESWVEKYKRQGSTPRYYLGFLLVSNAPRLLGRTT